ncbi:hypothetical protein RDABS01_023582 [Bienertia sinuspersici]
MKLLRLRMGKLMSTTMSSR